jgi:hypothetical protein
MDIEESNVERDTIYKSILQGFSIYFVIFAAYLELSPKLGNIWYRIQDDGIRRINLGYLLQFIILPFKQVWMWSPLNWDLNYFVGSIFASGLLYSFRIFNRFKIY